METENLMHFVWFGLDLTTVDAESIIGYNVIRMTNWAERNQHYTINFWTDNNSYGPVTESINNLGINNIEIINFDEYNFNCQNIGELRDLISFFRNPNGENSVYINEILRNQPRSFVELSPNYGAASDLARAIILNECGGIYLDLDTVAQTYDPLPNVKELLQGPTEILPLIEALRLLQKNPILVSYQNMANTNKLLPISNDVICCQPDSSVIQEYLRLYLDQIERFPNLLLKIAIRNREGDYNAKEVRFAATINLGPHLLRHLAIKHFFSEEMSELRSMQQEIDKLDYPFDPGLLLVDYTDGRNADTFDDLNKTKIMAVLQPLSLYFKAGQDNAWGRDRLAVVPEEAPAVPVNPAAPGIRNRA